MTIFNAYLNGQTELLEKLIGCMIGFVHVPPPGGPKLTFSIGGSDNQVIQPQLSGEIPATQESVAIIFNQLGRFWDMKLLSFIIWFAYEFSVCSYFKFCIYGNKWKKKTV